MERLVFAGRSAWASMKKLRRWIDGRVMKIFDE